ncbi:MAG: VOC family protein [Gulosibacter sp.]|uniref:VOC family protein n=1 Tax=Gulosibacter sp. TaxID=2817531 RepID=UPI003F9181E1
MNGEVEETSGLEDIGDTNFAQFNQLELVSNSPRDSAVYYEWLLQLKAGSRPGEALARIGVSGVISSGEGDVAPSWVPTFVVENLSLARRRVEELGGEVIPVVVDSGEHFYAKDPFGVIARLIDTTEARLFGDSAAVYCSVDYSTTDTVGPIAFWRQVLDCLVAEVVDDPYSMHFLHQGTQITTGVFSPGGHPDLRRAPEWIVYFEVDDVLLHATRAIESGSKVQIPPSYSPFNVYAVLRDPFGQMFGLSQGFRNASDGLTPLDVRVEGGQLQVLRDTLHL